jgi:hypothetical protein
MLLKSPETHSEFELTIVGYQFPKIENEMYDSNWLMISIKVTVPRGSWTATHPSLLTWEVERLADWLRAVAENEPVETEQDFIEPNLSFSIAGRSRDSITLRVYCGYESKPPWTRAGPATLEDHQVVLKVTPDDLKSAAESLRAQLSRFPLRAETSTNDS